MSGTETAEMLCYAFAMRCPVLTQAMLLPGQHSQLDATLTPSKGEGEGEGEGRVRKDMSVCSVATTTDTICAGRSDRLTESGGAHATPSHANCRCVHFASKRTKPRGA
eukprot:3940438-Rhodomonas_salina.1